VALAFLYLIRCSLHGAALKKNVPNLIRYDKENVVSESLEGQVGAQSRATSARFGIRGGPHRRGFSEVIDIENLVPVQPNSNPGTTAVRARPTQHSLKEILIQYGYSQFICSAVGGFPIVPSIAAAQTLFMVRTRPHYWPGPSFGMLTVVAVCSLEQSMSLRR
jgi:hypothetical protein